MECPRGGPLLPCPRVFHHSWHTNGISRNLTGSRVQPSSSISCQSAGEAVSLQRTCRQKSCGCFGKHIQILARRVEAGGCNSRGCWQCEDDRCGSRQDMPAFEPLEDAQSKLSTPHAAAGTYWPLTLPGTERNQLQRPLPARVAWNDKHLLRSGPACFQRRLIGREAFCSPPIRHKHGQEWESVVGVDWHGAA